MAIAASVSNMTTGMGPALVNDIVSVNQNHITVRPALHHHDHQYRQNRRYH